MSLIEERTSPAPRLPGHRALVCNPDRACIGVVVDRATTPDAEVLMACLLEGIDDVVSVVGHYPVRTA